MNREYRLAIFDFDGTLADSFPFFVSVFNTLAERHDFSRIDPSEVPALRHVDARQLMQHVALPAWKLPLVTASFIALMKRNAHSIVLFDRVEETLQHLAGAGMRLSIATSNSRDNVARILGAGNTALFSHMECGMSIFGKAARIRHILKQNDIPAHEAIYIGDQLSDMQAARKEGVAFGAVAWGYAAIESLRRHVPEEEFSEVTDIRRIAGTRRESACAR